MVYFVNYTQKFITMPIFFVSLLYWVYITHMKYVLCKIPEGVAH